MCVLLVVQLKSELTCKKEGRVSSLVEMPSTGSPLVMRGSLVSELSSQHFSLALIC